MRTEKKAAVQNGVARLVLTVAIIALEFYLLYAGFVKLYTAFAWIHTCVRIASLIVSIIIFGERRNAGIKMPWIILILLFPEFGLLLYTLGGRINVTKPMRKRYAAIDKLLHPMMAQDAAVAKKLRETDPALANICHYVRHYGPYPVYDNTAVQFYDMADQALEAMKADLRRAEHFIFMEYFAIEDAEAFASIYHILRQKVKEGVEVRLFYDDIGSIGFINQSFIKKMAADGIQCRDFNPVIPLLNVFMNNRDHRKFTVIDGKVAYSGGYNLANEYFNITHPYGYWKDTGIRLEGSAVRSFTLMFFEMWNAVKNTDTPDEIDTKYFAPWEPVEGAEGYVQPYADSPLDFEHVGEDVYLNLIKNAKHYFYLTTPYLILTDEMSRELGLAAKRGVDVRIITPGVPDKPLVYALTRSYYSQLVQNGVRIFEYQPGFIHAKQCICDGEAATVGTINLDYRSLYLHFECGVQLIKVPAIQNILADFNHTFTLCYEVTQTYQREHLSLFRQFIQSFLRLFAPLL